MEKKKKVIEISPKFISNVCDRLNDNKRVRRVLPQGGMLHIDRQLPFLCLYRQPQKEKDSGTSRLVKGEASYLIASRSPKLSKDLSVLVEGIVKVMTDECDAFLLIEVWSAAGKENEWKNVPEKLDPRIKIIVSQSKIPTATIQALESAFNKIRILKKPLKVEVSYQKNQFPEKLKPIISAAFAKEMNCFTIGLEIDPVYRDAATGDVFPLLLRRFHRGFSRAIKKGVFEFALSQTRLRPKSYQSLGRKAVVKSVWEVDSQLAEISNSYDFLLQVTPVNIESAWNGFKRKKFSVKPNFHYRPLAIDPSLLKRKLYNIPIERIEDPTISFLFREKRTQLEHELSMLRDRNTANFLFGSLQLYGEVSDELYSTAVEIMENTPLHGHSSSKEKTFNAEEFAQRATMEIEHYRSLYSGTISKVHLRNDTTGLMVSKGNLLVSKGIKIPESRVDALIQHEIGTHILTYINGRAQPFKQLYTGLAGYEELQEGVAVLSEYLVGGLNAQRLRLLAGRVLAAKYLTDGANFIDTFNKLNHEYGFSQKTSYIIAARIYRAGGLIKDSVYLRGFIEVLEYLREGGKINPLFVGKIAINHLSIIKELQDRKVLNPVPLQPIYLSSPETTDRLNKLRTSSGLLRLIKRR
jgi:uncharacterized protein (TIGR02421 family)